MAEYPPPTENLPIFDNNVFVKLDEFVTVDHINNNFLKFPIAQGAETLTDITVLGTSSFSGTETHNATETHNGQIIANNTITQNNAILNINQTDHTNDTLGNVLRATDIYGDLSLRRPTGINGGAMRLYDVTGTTTNSMQIFQSGAGAGITGLAPGGFINMSQRNVVDTLSRELIHASVAGGVNVQGWQSDNGGFLFNIQEMISGKSFGFIPNSTSGILNPLVQAGDNQIVCSNGAAQNGSVLVAGIWSNVCAGLKVNGPAGTTSIGQGGVGGTFTNSFSCSNTASTINGPAIFSSTTAPTSLQSPALATNDSSTKIPTTAWVQTAIAANASGPLFFRANLNQQPTVSGTATLNINFNGSVANINDSFLLRYTIRYDFNTSSTGQSLYYISYYGNMTVWPRRVVTNNGAVPVLLDGSISGNTSYTYNNATNAPLGRYIWVENYSNTQLTNPLNFTNNPVQLTFFDQTQVSFLFQEPYSAPASSSCSLGVSFELINTCSSTLTISAASIGFSNVNKNF